MSYIHFALLVFIVLCSSDGAVVFPAPPAVFSSLLPDNPAPFDPALTLLLFPFAPLKDDDPDVEPSNEVLEMSDTAGLFRVVLPAATFPFVA